MTTPNLIQLKRRPCPFCVVIGEMRPQDRALLLEARDALRAVTDYEDDESTGPWPAARRTLANLDEALK